MAKWLVLVDSTIGATAVLRAGAVVDDTVHDVLGYQAAGVPMVPYVPSIHDPIIAAQLANPSAERAFAPYLMAAQPAFQVLDSMTRIVYVAATGSDQTGNGTQAKPWATVGKAIAMMPRVFQSQGNTSPPTYIIRVIPPYSGPFGVFELNDLRFVGTPNVTSGQAVPRIVVQAYTATPGTLTDERFTVLAGPITPTAAAVFAGSRAKYTLPAATIGSSEVYTGKMVRVYQSGAEVARGIVLRSNNSTQELLVQAQQAWTPANTDTLYIVEPSVVLGGIPGGAAADFSAIRGLPNPFQFRFETIKTTDAWSTDGLGTILFSQCVMVANGGSGAGVQVDCTTQFQGQVVAGVSVADGSLVCGTSACRTSGGFVWQGNLILANASFLMGQVRPSLGGGTVNRGLQLLIGTCLRGLVDATFNRDGRVTISGGSAGNPVLLIHTSGACIWLRQGARGGHSGVVAVDAAVATGDVVEVQEATWTSVSEGTIGTFVPAEAGTPTMAAGRLVTVIHNGSARVNTTSTLAGSGGADVKAGANAAITLAALAALSPVRSTDNVALATISN